MTDEKIIELAEKTRKEKYCALYHNEKICSEMCPLAFDDETGIYCVEDTYKSYTNGFTDGFKAGFEKGKDSMSDYIIELQHAAYND